MMPGHDPWDEQWRIDAAKGVIVPGSVVRAGDGWRVFASPVPCGASEDHESSRFTRKTFMVLSRVPELELDTDGRRVGWDDVLLLEVMTGRVGWWMLDPGNPESIVLVR